jgi:hypothetical protein
VVATSPPRNRHQAYWLLEEPCSDHDLIERVNRGIPGADRASTDAAHMLRLPGYINIKYPDRPRAELILCEGERRYSIDQLASAFPYFETVSTRPKRRSDSSVPSWLSLVFDALIDHLDTTGKRPRARPGDSVQALCPLHDDRVPSLSLHPVRGWKCFAGCGEGRLTRLANLLGVRL